MSEANPRDRASGGVQVAQPLEKRLQPGQIVVHAVAAAGDDIAVAFAGIARPFALATVVNSEGKIRERAVRPVQQGAKHPGISPELRLQLLAHIVG